VLAVGHAYLAGTPLAKVAQTALDSLGKALGESCSAATLDGDNVLYIARAAVNNLLSIDLGRGSRLPAWATSMGRVLLSALPEEQLEVTLSRAAYSLHPHTLCDMAGLRAEIARVRMQGYALADRQIEVGLCSLAVPVLSRHGQVVAALNVGVPAATVSAAALKRRPSPRYGARRWTCRYSYSADCGFATWRGCARSRRPAAEAIHPPSPAPGCEPG
jgi:IclR family pca regulon transcriptional regulator